MWLPILMAVYCVLLVIASLAGGWLPSLVKMTHTRVQLTMSLVGGLMLGVAILHLLPHAAVAAGSLNVAVGSALVGLVSMFLMIRIFHVHPHGNPEPGHHRQHATTHPREREHLLEQDHGQEHEHVHHEHHGAHCSHGHSGRVGQGGQLAVHRGTETGVVGSDSGDPALPQAPGAHEAAATVFDASTCHRHPLSWIGLALGLSLHTVIDGMALAASVAIEASHVTTMSLVGIGTFLAVFLHKPLDSLSILSVMAAGGASTVRKRVVNFCFALICPIAFLVFLYGLQAHSNGHATWLGYALGFAAGAFICIALSDLLPEVQFHSHDRGKLSVALLLGVLLAYGIGYLESDHQHDFSVGGHGHAHHGHEHGVSSHDSHSHHDHSHEH